MLRQWYLRRWCAWRATRIQDPVARLRYLRQASLALGARPGSAPRRSLAWRFLAGLALLGFVAPRVSDSPWIPPHEPPAPAPPFRQPDPAPPQVWLVDKRGDLEIYSNGLVVNVAHQVHGNRRRYPVLDAATFEVVGWGSRPVGIVFHSTESLLVPFEPEKTRQLLRVGGLLLEYLQRQRAYNYLVDRFGQVYRIVPDQEVANHAGYSIWRDQNRLYLNLNASFLGVAFEARTEAALGAPETTPAQLRAARSLVEMLRSVHGIPAGNCVTHAQVSVNADFLRVGNHLDWADGFPYQELGLPDNYEVPMPSVALFGLRYDERQLATSPSGFARSLRRGVQELEQRARSLGMNPAQYQAAMRQRYREILRSLIEPTLSRERSS